jgi:hypothetical protein
VEQVQHDMGLLQQVFFSIFFNFLFFFQFLLQQVFFLKIKIFFIYSFIYLNFVAARAGGGRATCPTPRPQRRC